MFDAYYHLFTVIACKSFSAQSNCAQLCGVNINPGDNAPESAGKIAIPSSRLCMQISPVFFCMSYVTNLTIAAKCVLMNGARCRVALKPVRREQ